MSGATPQEHQNRKLLEQIQEKKKRLQHGSHHAPSAHKFEIPSASAMVPPPVQSPGSAPPAIVPGYSEAEYAKIANPQQRQAFKHAHTNSVGYFITQDSAFGNLILPVLPRMPDTPAVVAKVETK